MLIYQGDKLVRINKGVGDELPEGLYDDDVCSLPGFDDIHLSFYHEHLVDCPSKARAFCSLPFAHKLNWATKFISEKFPANKRCGSYALLHACVLLQLFCLYPINNAVWVILYSVANMLVPNQTMHRGLLFMYFVVNVCKF